MFMPHPPQGECLTAFSAYKEMLGIKAVSWSPSGQLLAVGDFEQARGQRVVREGCWDWLLRTAYDRSACSGRLPFKHQLFSAHVLLPALPPQTQGATVLNHVTWSPLAQFQHAPVITGPPTVGCLLLLLLGMARDVAVAVWSWQLC